MSSAKNFFLKFTERDRPTVKPIASSKGPSYFLKKRQGNIVCSTVGPSLQEVIGKCSVSAAPEIQKHTARGKSEGASIRAWACWEESTSTSSSTSSTSSLSSYPSLSRSFYLSIGFYISQPSSRCDLQPVLNTLYKLI